MIAKTCKPKVENIITLFSDALLKKDINGIKDLLNEEGEFEIQSPKFKTLQVNKKRFVAWLNSRLKQTESLTVAFDQCLHCSLGRTVLLVNDGTFPRQIRDSSERSKTGLMLKVKEGQISQIKFCFVFVKTENRYIYELKTDKVRHYESLGYSMWEAIELAELNNSES
jgi:hypothetical protein